MNRAMVFEFIKKRWQNLFVWYTCQLVESTQKRDVSVIVYNTKTPEFSSCPRYTPGVNSDFSATQGETQ